MKRTVYFLFVCLLICSIFSGCSRQEKGASLIPDIDWEAKIHEETIFQETAIDKAIADAVTLKVTDVTEEVITVKITAPDIGDEIIAWYDSVPENEFSEAAMETEIIRLIGEGQAEETDLTLNYVYKPTEEVIINYTNAYYNEIYCGIAAFYDYAMAGLYEEVIEMGDGNAE